MAALSRVTESELRAIARGEPLPALTGEIRHDDSGRGEPDSSVIADSSRKGTVSRPPTEQRAKLENTNLTGEQIMDNSYSAPRPTRRRQLCAKHGNWRSNCLDGLDQEIAENIAAAAPRVPSAPTFGV